MVTEIELKYSLLESKEMATPEQVKRKISQLLINNALAFEHQEKQLSNYYFDTPELTLRKNKIALRTRATKVFGEKEWFEQTIKTSGTVIAGLHQRPEYNVDIKDDKPILTLFPNTLWETQTDLGKLQQQIIELFSTHFTRHTWLVNIDNAQIEIAFDCGDIACQGNVNKPKIYEIELELVKGDPKTLFTLTKHLFSQLSLRPGQLTKAARGYALYHESIKNSDNASTLNKNKPRNIIDKAPSPRIDLSKYSDKNTDFIECIEYSLKHIQLSVDSYVANYIEGLSSSNKINVVRESLVQLQQVFDLFANTVTTEELTLAKELRYFIQSIITYGQSAQDEVINDAKVLTLLHSERFNNLQLDLLNALLNRNNNDKKK